MNRATSLAASVAAVILVVGCTSSPGGPVDGTAQPSDASPTASGAPTPTGTPIATATGEPTPTPEPTDASSPTALPEPNPTDDVIETPLNRPGSTMTLLIEHYSGAVLGNDSLAGAGHTVTNLFDAELVQHADGTWHGPADATSTGDSKVVFLTEECTTSWDGTQTFDLIGESGAFAAGNNFRIQFLPTSAPVYTTAPDTECDDPGQHPNGFDLMPYHHTTITDGGFVEMKVAPPPGGEAVYEDDLNEVIVVSFSWTTLAEYR